MRNLQPDPLNARRHPKRNKQMIRESLQECGAFRSIAVDGDDIVRAGNGVLEQATAMGLSVRIVDAAPDELIAVRRADLKGAAAVRAALWDNATSETSEWDPAAFMEMDDAAFAGILGEDVVDELRELAAVSEQLEEDLDEEPNTIELSQAKGRTIRPVMVLDDIRAFERAIKATGEQRRSTALAVICREYLERHGIDAGAEPVSEPGPVES